MSVPSPASGPRYVFVVTYGRSGSTLIQGMLNALPRTLVRGENNFFLLPLFRSWLVVKNHKARLRGRREKSISAFYGVHELDLDAFADSARDLVRVQLLGSRPPGDVDRLGFKEVHWNRIKRDETADFFEFMDLTFQDPLYVLNRRDVEMASTSGFYRLREPGEALRQINRVRKLQDFLRESRPDRCYDTTYEMTTSDDRDEAAASMRGLAEFVTGSCDDELLERLLALRDVAHGPKPFGKTRDA